MNEDIEKLFDTLDRQIGPVIAALQKVEMDQGPEARERLSTALEMGLASRLVTFALGPVSQLYPEKVDPVTLDILSVLHDLRHDLTPRRHEQ